MRMEERGARKQRMAGERMAKREARTERREARTERREARAERRDRREAKAGRQSIKGKGGATRGPVARPSVEPGSRPYRPQPSPNGPVARPSVEPGSRPIQPFPMPGGNDVKDIRGTDNPLNRKKRGGGDGKVYMGGPVSGALEAALVSQVDLVAGVDLMERPPGGRPPGGPVSRPAVEPGGRPIVLSLLQVVDLVEPAWTSSSWPCFSSSGRTWWSSLTSSAFFKWP